MNNKTFLRVNLKITSPFFEIENNNISEASAREHIRRAVCWHNSYMRILNPKPHPLRCSDVTEYCRAMTTYRRNKRNHPFTVTVIPVTLNAFSS